MILQALSRSALLAALATALALPHAPVQGAARTSTTVDGWSTAGVALAADEPLSRSVTVRTGTATPARKVLLQFRAEAQQGWQRLATTTSGRRGLAVLDTASVPGSGWLRVKVAATTQAAGATTPRTVVTVTEPTEPTDPTGPGDPPGWTASEFESEVLRLTNELRASGTTCGATAYGPKPALTASPELGEASRRYARRMGEEGFFDHVSPSGDDPGDRARAAGYAWRSYGENIAAGYRTPAEVVEGWRTSEGHCHNLMGTFVHLGVGYAEVGGSRYGRYWVQMFGTPAR